MITPGSEEGQSRHDSPEESKKAALKSTVQCLRQSNEETLYLTGIACLYELGFMDSILSQVTGNLTPNKNGKERTFTGSYTSKVQIHSGFRPSSKRVSNSVTRAGGPISQLCSLLCVSQVFRSAFLPWFPHGCQHSWGCILADLSSQKETSAFVPELSRDSL